ncbi:MAG: helix-turn-helix domain-containing protein, partial [Rhodococcus sp. (in: high G+C Gram-positive bacteria)]
MRRTQEQRRTDTIARLLDAAITSLAEKGYAATTVNEVVTRAGVSSGALFRHFPTRLDVMVAA